MMNFEESVGNGKVRIVVWSKFQWYLRQ